MRRLWAILACGLLAAPALAAGPGTLTVDDKAGAFTPGGVTKAKELMESASFGSPLHLTVATAGDKDFPAAHKPALDAARKAKDNDAGRRAVTAWAADLGMAATDKGIVAAVYTEGKSAIAAVKADRTTDLRGLTAAEDHKIEELLAKAFKEGKADQGLYDAVGELVNKLKNTSAPEKAAPVAAAGGGPQAKQPGGMGMSIGGLVCIGLLVAGGLWLVFGLIRSFTRPRGGYGPGGYNQGQGGYGPGGYGGGGGGGGFMSGMMGGLFGAVAGNYLYNSFMGGGSALGASGLDGSGAGGGFPDAAGGEGDYGGGSEGGGAGGFDDAGTDAGAGGFDDAGGAGGYDDAGGGDYGGDAGGGGDYGGGDGGGDW